MKYRKLKFNGQRVSEEVASVKMTIDSKCPKKWAFVDMETGQIWVHKSRNKKLKNIICTFCIADEDALRALQNIVDDIRNKEMGFTVECT